MWCGVVGLGFCPIFLCMAPLFSCTRQSTLAFCVCPHFLVRKREMVLCCLAAGCGGGGSTTACSRPFVAPLFQHLLFSLFPCCYQHAVEHARGQWALKNEGFRIRVGKEIKKARTNRPASVAVGLREGFKRPYFGVPHSTRHSHMESEHLGSRAKRPEGPLLHPFQGRPFGPP